MLEFKNDQKAARQRRVETVPKKGNSRCAGDMVIRHDSCSHGAARMTNRALRNGHSKITQARLHR